MLDRKSVKVKVYKSAAVYTLYEAVSGEDLIFSVEIEMDGIVERADDICREQRKAEKLLFLLAAEDVEPCHLLDIVYDALPL